MDIYHKCCCCYDLIGRGAVLEVTIIQLEVGRRRSFMRALSLLHTTILPFHPSGRARSFGFFPEPAERGYINFWHAARRFLLSAPGLCSKRTVASKTRRIESLCSPPRDPWARGIRKVFLF